MFSDIHYHITFLFFSFLHFCISLCDNGVSCVKWQWLIIKYYIYKYIPCGDYFKTNFLPTLQKYFSMFSPCQVFERSLEPLTLLVHLDISRVRVSRLRCHWFRICFDIVFFFMICILQDLGCQEAVLLLTFNVRRRIGKIFQKICSYVTMLNCNGGGVFNVYLYAFILTYIYASCMCVGNIV